MTLKTLFFLGVSFFGLSCNAAQNYQKMEIARANFDPLKLLIMLDTSQEESQAIRESGEENAGGAMSVELTAALQQEQNVLASSPLVSALFHLHTPEIKKMSSNDDNVNCSIYVTLGNEYYLFLFNNNKSLRELGFNDSKFEKIEPGDLWNRLYGPEGSKTSPLQAARASINVDLLKELFLQDNAASKFIALSGHGMYEKTIAGLTIPHYQELIEFFEKIGCLFLNVLSCYVGGSNLVEGHKHLLSALTEHEEKNPKKIISYPIVLTGLTDTPTSVSHEKLPNIKGFFADLMSFFRARQGTAIVDWYDRPFSTILAHMTMGRTQNFPQIRFPNFRGYFTPVDADKIATFITYPALLAHELKDKHKPLDIKEETELILLYPSVVSVPLQFGSKLIKARLGDNDKSLPFVISMIHGNAQHVIKELRIVNEKSFKNLEIFDSKNIGWHKIFREFKPGFVRKSKKLFIIKKLVVLDKTYENVLVYSDSEYDASSLTVICLSDYSESFILKKWEKDVEYPEEHSHLEIMLKDIDQEMFKKTVPSPEALFQATGGIESIKHFDKAAGPIQDLFKKYITYLEEKDAYVPLHLLFESKNFDKALELLKSNNKLSLDRYQEYFGNDFIMPLFMLKQNQMSMEKKVGFLKEFMNRQFDVNKQDKDGNTILHGFVERGRLIPDIQNLVKKLSEMKEFNWNIQNRVGKTMLHQAIKFGIRGELGGNGLALIKALLEEKKVDEKIKDKKGFTAFGWVDFQELNFFLDSRLSTLEKIGLLNIFGNHGVNLNDYDKSKNTILHHLDDFKGRIVFKEFIPELAKISPLNWNAQNSKGQTPLHMAVNKKNIGLVRQLLMINLLNRDIKDKKGKTALERAEETLKKAPNNEERKEMVEMLKK